LSPLKEGRFRLHIRQTYRLPGEVVDAPSLEPVKVRLDGAPST